MYHSILYALTRGLFFFFLESSTRGFDILSASLSFFSPDEYSFLFFYGFYRSSGGYQLLNQPDF